MESPRRRLSPSMVVAMVALIVGLSGTAVAAIARNSVLSRHIKNGEVKRVDLANNAVNSVKVKNGSLALVDIAPGAVAKLKPMWAVVNANGSLARSSSGVSSQNTGASFYTVTFPANVRECAYVATIGGTGTTYGGKGEISVYSHPANTNTVVVVTHNDSGVFTDFPFHVIVTC
jgi:hypothetical protein